MTIQTKAQLRSLIRRAELRASLLRQPGFHRLGQAERTHIADDLEALAQFARRAFGPIVLPDVAPLLYDQAADDDATDADLFGGAA